MVDSLEYEDVSELEEIVEPVAQGVEGGEAAPLGLPTAFDSHFHLDRTRRDLELHSRSTLQDIQQVVGPASSGKEVEVSVCVAVFCDPDRYVFPSGAEIEVLRKRGVQVDIGVHPKARMQHSDQWRDFHLALSTLGMVALGEIGLDFAGSSPSTQEAR